ncbi:NAD(P)H-dependent oxidoreductase [Galbitalea sp. SE-J8]|uniref:NAD(P)H-dependent oxidoreductase n=1 Tax=Galbitalea sp. SE-J8 TaxID=3054952 RepID=UPI00259CD532|nr:NAD(P)H-dependent oxidoreductase [Galbitalea sp. SE-J8]MDM4761756.1 NAD(P)H-dependent oxidoreductase [Galbitalea sp. SE-J8]
MPLSVVTVSGSLHAPSKTSRLLERITGALAARRDVSVDAIEVTGIGGLGAALGRGPLPGPVADAVARIQGADLLVVATPVYRGSYTGLFKHLVDLLPQTALAGTPVLLAAVGGDDRHSLVIEHELRPLLAFFGALTLPLGVYARDADVADDPDGRLTAAIAAALDAAEPVLP